MAAPTTFAEGVTSFSVLAAGPTPRAGTVPTTEPQSPFSPRPRPVPLASATLIVPAILLLENHLDTVRAATVPTAFFGLLFLPVILLVILRLVGRVVPHRAAAAREQILRTAAASLVAADGTQAIARACDTAVTALLGPNVRHRTMLLPAPRAQELCGFLAQSTIAPRTLLLPVHRLGPDLAAELGDLPAALVCSMARPDRRSGDGPVGVLLAAGPERRLVETRGSLEILASHAALAADRLALRQEVARQESEAYFRTLVRNAWDAILIVNDDTTVRYASPSAQAVFGGRAPTGTALHELVDPQDRERVGRTLAALDADERQEIHDYWWVAQEGGPRELEVRCRDLRQEETLGGLVITLRDVTEQRRLEHELTRRAFHDPLTGLPNRTLLVERTGRALLRGHRESTLTCLLFIDLDDFKSVNDTMGHSAGDRLLIAVGERLTRTLRRTDTAARLGGDEFVVLMEDARQPVDAELLAAQVIQSLSRPFQLTEGPVTISASVGVATALDTTDAEELLALADVALYEGKAAGKRQWRRFRPRLRVHMTERDELRARLDDAVVREEFALRYQPVVDITSGDVVGFEALARWPHRSGPVAPERFIALAEETGRITPLGAWVLRNATADMARLQHWAPRSAPPYISVNVSGRQWQDARFLEDVRRALQTPGLVPGSLQLELTESVLMERDDRLDTVIRTLKDLGVRTAVDDFGTGFSSLRYLREFPIDVLKIDKTFIDDIPMNSRQCALVQGIVRLADTLGLQVIAEGVEERAQRDRLIAMGCRFGQGYLFARPMTVEQCEAVLRGGSRPAVSTVLP